jgi:hypothetical protein
MSGMNLPEGLEHIRGVRRISRKIFQIAKGVVPVFLLHILSGACRHTCERDSPTLRPGANSKQSQ